MSNRVHAFAPFAAALRAPLERVLPDREIVCWSKPQELAAGIDEAEYLLVLDPPRSHWARARRLRLLQSLGAGVDGILPAEGLPDRVQIANNRGMSAPTMAEFGLALLLALLKGLPGASAAQREHRWQRYLPHTAAGSTLGILGLGAIGEALAERAVALGMRVIGTQRSPKPCPVAEQVWPAGETDRVLAESDAVVVLLPLTPETRGLLGAERLARMKPGAVLVNLARGGIVDETALLDALREERLGGAALDVFGSEPLPAESPLWDAPNLIVTPHVAGAFPDLLERAAERFAENVHRVERGEPPRSPVDRERGY